MARPVAVEVPLAPEEAAYLVSATQAARAVDREPMLVAVEVEQGPLGSMLSLAQAAERVALAVPPRCVPEAPSPMQGAAEERPTFPVSLVLVERAVVVLALRLAATTATRAPRTLVAVEAEQGAPTVPALSLSVALAVPALS